MTKWSWLQNLANTKYGLVAVLIQELKENLR